MHATIAAISTAPGAGGIGIIRISGPSAIAAASRICARSVEQLAPRRASLTRLKVGDKFVDVGMVVAFPGPHSATGEDVVEVHAHGAPVVLSMLLRQVMTHPEVRLAEPGEFTRRAVMNQRIDLIQAEAVADLIGSESEAQVRAAAAQLHGELSHRVDEIRTSLLSLAADADGVLEFPDEARDADAELAVRLSAARAQLELLCADAARGALIRRTAKVVLYGPTNAGKSTLFNALVGEERALTDDAPGTTRDALEARLEVDGVALTLVDTAGLRDASVAIEAKGIARSRVALAQADVAVLVIPPDATASEVEAWRSEVDSPRRMEVEGKVDLLTGDRPDGVSGATGAGVDNLRTRIAARLALGVAGAALVTADRHRACLERARQHLERASAAESELELVSEEVKLALEELSAMTGTNATADVIDAIFARFCIGK